MPPRPRTDLGPVPFTATLEHQPRDERGPAPERVPGGPLARLAAVHSRHYRGKWSLTFGDVPVKLKTHVDLGSVEELFVFLVELVDGGFGEWSIEDKDELLVVEATVNGVDVDLEFGDGDGGEARFRRVRFPKRATVRLAAVVNECARLLRRLVVDASVADPEFGDEPALAELREDLAALTEAVAGMPEAFRSKEPVA